MTSDKRLILVTGCPRSGTTVVGSILAEAPGARYLYEPFNYHSGMRCINRYFEMPGTQEYPMEVFDQSVKHIRSLRLKLKPGLFPEDRGWRRLVKTIVGGRSRLSYYMCRMDWRLKTIIWKDPLAAFAAKAAADRHDIDVLVTLRDPIAVAASFKRMNWSFDLTDISGRLQSVGYGDPLLISTYHQHLQTSAINGAILWKLIYSTLLKWASTTNRIHWLDMQTIVANPVAEYERTYRAIGLQWSPKVRWAIEQTYQARPSRNAPSDLPRRAHVGGRDLSTINSYGQQLLSHTELRVIEEITAALWQDLRGLRSAGLDPLSQSSAQ